MLVAVLPNPAGAAGQGALSLLPPLLAVSLAVATRKVHLPLFLGVCAGAFLLAEGTWVPALAMAPVRAVGSHIVQNSIYDFGDGSWQLFSIHILLFVTLLMSLVGVIARGGGTEALVEKLIGRSNNRQGATVSTWLLGLAIFFDDYTNTVVVGSSMRGVYDRLGIAREKLAYLVDSTAAPVAGLSLLSTWVAYEVSQFAPGLPSIGLTEQDGYGIFLQSLPYRFYCWFALAAAGLVAWRAFDFGEMRRAEQRALMGETSQPETQLHAAAARTTRVLGESAPGVSPYIATAVLPVATVVSCILLQLFWMGHHSLLESGAPAGQGLGYLRAVLGAVDDPSPILSRAALLGLGVAVVLSVRAGMPYREMGLIARGTASLLLPALALLLLAWAIGDVCGQLETGSYLAALLGNRLPSWLLPSALFVLGAVVAFCTGSSWSTMAVLLPITVPMAWAFGMDSGIGSMGMLLICIGAALDGSIFGDHCSPISDTTVLSSVASGCDHLAHVRTQLPYALLSMFVAVSVGYIPAGLGLSPWLCLPVGMGVLALALWAFGGRAQRAS